MKVYYKTVDRLESIKNSRYESDPENSRYRFHYIIIQTDFCCDSIKSAWDDSYIGFGEDGYSDSPKQVNIEKQGYDEPDHLAITFCPFCATRIEAIEKERVKLKAIEKERKAEKYIDYVEEKE